MRLQEFFIHESNDNAADFVPFRKGMSFDEWYAAAADARGGDMSIATPEFQEAAHMAWRRGENPGDFVEHFMDSPGPTDDQYTALDGDVAKRWGDDPEHPFDASGGMDDFYLSTADDPDDPYADEIPDELGPTGRRGRSPRRIPAHQTTAFNDEEPIRAHEAAGDARGRDELPSQAPGRTGARFGATGAVQPKTDIKGEAADFPSDPGTGSSVLSDPLGGMDGKAKWHKPKKSSRSNPEAHPDRKSSSRAVERSSHAWDRMRDDGPSPQSPDVKDYRRKATPADHHRDYKTMHTEAAYSLGKLTSPGDPERDYSAEEVEQDFPRELADLRALFPDENEISMGTFRVHDTDFGKELYFFPATGEDPWSYDEQHGWDEVEDWQPRSGIGDLDSPQPDVPPEDAQFGGGGDEPGFGAPTPAALTDPEIDVEPDLPATWDDYTK